MEKQKVKAEVVQLGDEGSLLRYEYGAVPVKQIFWWPYPLPVGAEVEVTVKVK